MNTPRTSRKAHLISLYTMIRKEVIRVLRIWPQTLLPPTITITLYFFIFGQLMGARIGSIAGIDYIQYLAPGLVMMAIITNAYINVVSSFFTSKFTKCIEEILITPTPTSIIILGQISGGILRSILITLIISAIALIFTDLHFQHPWLTLLLVFLTATLFALAGLINGIFAKRFDDTNIIPTFILTPLSYLGGIFYSIDMLPEPWHTVTLFNPIVYIVSSFRYCILGIREVNVYTSFALIILFIAILYGYTFSRLKKGKGIKS